MREIFENVWGIRKTKNNSLNIKLSFILVGMSIFIPLIFIIVSWLFVFNFRVNHLQSYDISARDSVAHLIKVALDDTQERIGLWGTVKLAYTRIQYECHFEVCNVSHLIVGTAIEPHLKTSLLPSNFVNISEYGFDTIASSLSIATMINHALPEMAYSDDINNLTLDIPEILKLTQNKMRNFHIEQVYNITLNWGKAWDWNWHIRLYDENNGLIFCVESC